MTSGKIAVPGCRNTTVQELFVEDGVQVLKVDVDLGGEIPLHSHQCAATMIIVKGEALTLGKNGKVATTGDVVVKAANEPHGFTKIEGPFSFISISDKGGIMQAEGWDMTFLPG